MTSDEELLRWLRDPDYNDEFQLLRSWSEIERMHTAAAAAIERLTGERDTAVKLLERVDPVLRNLGYEDGCPLRIAIQRATHPHDTVSVARESEG